MEQETIQKRKGVQLAKKRLKEFLKPYGFQVHPLSSNRFARVRDEFIDEVRLDTAGYHLDPSYYIYFRLAPFAWLKCGNGRLWRMAKETCSKDLDLWWHCGFPRNGGSYCYKATKFESVWQDVSYALEQYILPQMEEMAAEAFLAELVERSRDDHVLFLAHSTVYFDSLYYDCMSEAAAYGTGQWWMKQYEEGIPYLTFARDKYRKWLTGHEQDTNHGYSCRRLTLALMNDLLSLWEGKEDGWMEHAQTLISQAADNWEEYML